MAKINTPFMTKTFPFRAAHTYIAHIREYPPGVSPTLGVLPHRFLRKRETRCLQFINHHRVDYNCYGFENKLSLKYTAEGDVVFTPFTSFQ